MGQNGSYFNFTGNVAVVTGGSTGIGRATALLFARHGAKVVIGDVNPEGLETVATIKREGGDALFVETDVRHAEQVQDLVATAVETYGGLHCAFNNAGVLPAGVLLADVEDAAFGQQPWDDECPGPHPKLQPREWSQSDGVFGAELRSNERQFRLRRRGPRFQSRQRGGANSERFSNFQRSGGGGRSSSGRGGGRRR